VPAKSEIVMKETILIMFCAINHYFLRIDTRSVVSAL
jgi:hypothetical protein